MAALARALAGVELDRLRLAGIIRTALAEGGLADEDLDRSSAIVRALAGLGPEQIGFDQAAVMTWFEDRSVRTALHVHEWQGTEYFEREAWQQWLAAIAEAAGAPRSSGPSALDRAAADAGYRVAELLSALRPRRRGANRRGSRRS
jgi:hypothetical protein